MYALLQVELELAIDTRSANYDRSKGEQIALNVDGAGGSGDQGTNFYVSDRMDKQVLSSVRSGLPTGRFAGSQVLGSVHSDCESDVANNWVLLVSIELFKSNNVNIKGKFAFAFEFTQCEQAFRF